MKRLVTRVLAAVTLGVALSASARSITGATFTQASAKWRVTLNGAAVPSGYAGMAVVRDGVVYASVARGGTYFILR